ncbi:MAG: DNA repair protein RadC [Endomicrobiaceae bacterium]|nr:DNA repair protein RadC [Endomicrobiaceae bacterium]
METNYRGHRQRLKERFLNSKLAKWQDYEILEFALTFTIPRKDTKKIAKQLLSKFGNLKQVLNTDIDKLKTIDGIKNQSGFFIAFLRSFAVKYAELEMVEKEKISSPKEALIFLRSVIGLSKDEIFYAIFLNASNKILFYDEINRGIVNKSAVYPRKIVEIALKYNATSVIVAHNHPGGSSNPSQNDIIATEAITKALKTVDISLLDHLIVTDKNHYSFKDNGLI